MDGILLRLLCVESQVLSWVFFFSDLYVIGLTGMAVGNSAMAASFRAFVDSGTSFTYLGEPMYTSLAQTVRHICLPRPRSHDSMEDDIDSFLHSLTRKSGRNGAHPIQIFPSITATI